MSDLHHMPLMGHDLETRPVVRGRVFKAGRYWYWGFEAPVLLRHGPFCSWREAYDSAWRMVEAL